VGERGGRYCQGGRSPNLCDMYSGIGERVTKRGERPGGGSMCSGEVRPAWLGCNFLEKSRNFGGFVGKWGR